MLKALYRKITSGFGCIITANCCCCSTLQFRLSFFFNHFISCHGHILTHTHTHHLWGVLRAIENLLEFRYLFCAFNSHFAEFRACYSVQYCCVLSCLGLCFSFSSSIEYVWQYTFIYGWYCWYFSNFIFQALGALIYH